MVGEACNHAMAWRLRDAPPPERPGRLFEEVVRLTPTSEVRRQIQAAQATPAGTPIAQVASQLGCGYQVTAPDTVPFCLWVAAHHLDSYVEALGQAISAGGDCDTNAAIVGGITILSVGRDGVPHDWLQARESSFDKQ